MFAYTTAVKKLRALKARKKIVQGGTSAGKTHGIIPILIDQAAKNPRLKITVVAETIPAARDGAVDIFKEVMQFTNRWIDDHWSANPMEYTFSNGSKIQFKSFDTVGKAKAAGKRDVLFLNEANHIDYKIADALITRSKDIWIDFNADEEFWAHTELMDDHDSEFLILTYRDNEAIPEEILSELMIKKERAQTSKYWAHWWEIYGEGQVGTPFADNAFAYNFKDHHVKPCYHLPERELIISMDFNIEPFAFIYSHVWQDRDGWHCHIFMEETIESGSIHKAVENIKYKFHQHTWNCIITGDYNGNKRELSQNDHASNFEQIRRELGISARQIQTSPNPKHINSRNDLNYVLYHSEGKPHDIDFRIDPRCENTIRDLRFVEADGTGSIAKSNRKHEHERADHMDAVRYLVNHEKVQKWIKFRQKLRM